MILTIVLGVADIVFAIMLYIFCRKTIKTKIELENTQEVVKQAQDLINSSIQEKESLDKSLKDLYLKLDKSELQLAQNNSDCDRLQKAILESQNELSELLKTKAAAIEAEQKDKMIAAEKENYQLILSKDEIRDIDFLLEIRYKLKAPRVLDMLIWQSFYQKKMNALCAKVVGARKISGIYKITNQLNGLCYIGQSKDITDRFKEHAKMGLGIDTPVGNKLYAAMQESGLYNFTWEVIEECPPEELNQKEKFYIELYQSKNYGYNSNAGINK